MGTTVPQSLCLDRIQAQLIFTYLSQLFIQTLVQALLGLSWFRCYGETELSVISVLVALCPQTPSVCSPWLQIDVK